jgi:DNA-binding CsgD family transcriptional regulator
MQRQKTPLLPESYVLCERSSGAVRFRVEAESDGGLPVDKIAGLLAVHCLVRGQAPEDYEVMVVTQSSLLHNVFERAGQLLAAGLDLGARVKVSRRERDVLDGILQNLANKEIAAKLNVAERTVKFHVSSLLAKFGVTDRIALSREVSLGRKPAHVPEHQAPSQSLFGYAAGLRERVAEKKVSASHALQRGAENPREHGAVFPIYPRQRYAT